MNDKRQGESSESFFGKIYEEERTVSLVLSVARREQTNFSTNNLGDSQDSLTFAVEINNYPIMRRTYINRIRRVMLTVVACCAAITVLAGSEVHVDKAGTLATLLPTSESELKVTGSINGTDVKYLRQLVTEGGVTAPCSTTM